jgi:uridine kinase
MVHIERLRILINDILKSPGIKIIAIDGNCAAGKSTLAATIQEEYDCNVFHMDDYYLPLHKKTKERLNEVGGNVDRERFKEEILDKIRSDESFIYKIYDCKGQSLHPSERIYLKKLNIVEGVYSMHPELAGFYDLTVFLTIGEAEQSRRLSVREDPKIYERFIREWIPLENRYFKELRIKDTCDLILTL